MCGVIAEFERSINRERINAGLAKAWKCPAYGPMPKRVNLTPVFGISILEMPIKNSSRKLDPTASEKGERNGRKHRTDS